MSIEVEVEIEVGEGARRALAVDGRGQVVAVYRRAAYVRMPAGLLALTTADVWRGPLHLRGPLRPDLLAPGDRVDVVGGSRLAIGTTEIDLSAARLWRGPLPHPAWLAAAASHRATSAVFAAAPPSALRGPVFAERLGVALHRLGHRDLAGVARAIGGLGPGLTPSGDDVLAGILLVSRALGGQAAEDGLVVVAGGVRTTSVAREFLDWAARGQSVEPVHGLLAALAGADGPGAAAHLATLVGLGHTSGADLAYGIALGLGVDPGVGGVGGIRLGLGVGGARLGARVARVSPA